LVIRGGVYRVDLGEARRGHEQRGRRCGLVLSPTDMAWRVATIAPTSTQAQPAVFRPEIELGGIPTRFLVDQLRSIDVRFIDGEAAYFLHPRGSDRSRAVDRVPGNGVHPNGGLTRQKGCQTTPRRDHP
jgi:mRNA interferase MazF